MKHGLLIFVPRSNHGNLTEGMKKTINKSENIKLNNPWWTVSLQWTWPYVCPGGGVLRRLEQMCSLQGKQTAGSAAKGFKLEPWDHESPLLHWRNLRQHLRGPMPGPRGTKAWLGCGSTLEWVAMPSSRGSSQPLDWTSVSHTAGRFFTVWATR